MKGIIFNLLEDYINNQLYEDAWEEIVDKCHLDTEAPLDIVGPGTYSDHDFEEIAAKSAIRLKTSKEKLLCQFGRFSLPAIARRYPAFFAPFKHPQDFLKSTGMIHQTEIKKLYKDAETPQFSYYNIDDNHAVLRYSSNRNLKYMVEGLLQGLGDYYKVPLEIMSKKKEQKVWEFTIKFPSAP